MHVAKTCLYLPFYLRSAILCKFYSGHTYNKVGILWAYREAAQEQHKQNIWYTKAYIKFYIKSLINWAPLSKGGIGPMYPDRPRVKCRDLDK